MSSKCLNLLTSLTLAAGNAQAIACTYDPGVTLDASHEVTLTFRGPTAPDDIKPIEFDPKTWAVGATDYEVKIAMFKGFLEKYQLNGMTEGKVFALLGHGLAKGPAGYHGDVGWVVHGLMGERPTDSKYVWRNDSFQKSDRREVVLRQKRR
jgi:hypothetical protein